MKCSGCIDAPEYQPGDAASTVYCNSNCQKAHWLGHKAHCRALKQRKKLLRTGTILKAALLTYRELFYGVDLTKMELRIGFLYQNLRSTTTRAKRGHFPADLTTNGDYKEAALANNQCTTAMALLRRLTRKLLEGETLLKSCSDKVRLTIIRSSLQN